jgi:hypothetical protein
MHHAGCAPGVLATIQRHPVVGGGGPVVGGTKQWPHMSHFAVALHMVQFVYSKVVATPTTTATVVLTNQVADGSLVF